MCFQIVQAGEREAAEGAGEGLLPGVRCDVPPPRAWVRERFLTDAAVVGLLTSFLKKKKGKKESDLNVAADSKTVM